VSRFIQPNADGSPRGAFIALEGCDGAGTTTQRDRIVQRVRCLPFLRVRSTGQPSTGPMGTLIREVLAGQGTVDPEALQRLFIADRVDHLARVIEPSLAAGEHVVCDRSELSTAIYYAAGLPVEDEDDAMVRAFSWHEGIQAPMLTVILMVPAEVAAERRAARGGAPELFERAAFQARVAGLYEAEAEAGRAGHVRYSPWRHRSNPIHSEPWLIGVDGTGTPDELEARIWAIVKELIQ
jgi:dTMP kinase